jgi:hypothetical protein
MNTYTDMRAHEHANKNACTYICVADGKRRKKQALRYKNRVSERMRYFSSETVSWSELKCNDILVESSELVK